MIAVSEDRKTLAYIGDAALETGVMASTWSLQETQKIPLNEFLHDERNKLVENEPLSRFWDSLELNDPPVIASLPPENDTTKGPPWKLFLALSFSKADWRL